MFSFDPATAIERIKERVSGKAEGEAAALIEMLGQIDLTEFGAYDMLLAEKGGVDKLLDGLSFFIRGDIEFQPQSRAFAVGNEDKPVGIITRDNYTELKDAILAFSLPNGESDKELKFSSESARRVYERCEAGRKKAKRQKPDAQNAADYDLGNIISAIATEHNSLNLLNIWGLTPYQLYNQFARVDRKVQLDVVSLKWAAWGSDPFEFDTWRKAINTKGE